MDGIKIRRPVLFSGARKPAGLTVSDRWLGTATFEVFDALRLFLIGRLVGRPGDEAVHHLAILLHRDDPLAVPCGGWGAIPLCPGPHPYGRGDRNRSAWGGAGVPTSTPDPGATNPDDNCLCLDTALQPQQA